VMIDTVASYGRKQHGDFDFRSGEVALSASVDPFARAYAFFNGTPDGVEVEEAAIQTTSLPYSLAVKGGRFFADFGRLAKFHPHDLPFVNEPIVLERFVGGESQADGLETSWLVPIPYYLSLTAGAYDKIGSDNDRVDSSQPRDLSEFTYLGRAFSFVSITDAQSLDLGASWAFTPKVQVDDGGARSLAGLDLTYRYAPLDTAGYRGLTWGTEVLWNDEDRRVGGAPDGDFRRRDAVGLYSYVETRVTRRFTPGVLFEWSQDVDRTKGATFAYSPYLTVWASEFQRLRFQYTHLDEPGDHDDLFYLQWTVALGSHVHGFKDR